MGEGGDSGAVLSGGDLPSVSIASPSDSCDGGSGTCATDHRAVNTVAAAAAKSSTHNRHGLNESATLALV